MISWWTQPSILVLMCMYTREMNQEAPKHTKVVISILIETKFQNALYTYLKSFI